MDKRKTQVSKAIEIALRHPDGLHPLQVATEALKINSDSDDFETFLVGLLHDSIEDEYIDESELSAFDNRVIAAVSCLSRKDGEEYWSYIDRIKDEGSELVRRVKLADAKVNFARCKNELGHQGKAKRYKRVIEELKALK